MGLKEHGANMTDLKILGIGVYEDEGLPILLLYLAGTERVLCLPLDAGDLFAISTALQQLEYKEHPALLNFDKSMNGDVLLQDLEDFVPNLPIGSLARPISANLTLKLVRVLGGQILGVEVSGIQDDVFVAHVVCSKGTSISRLGCNIVDGILLALHGNALLRCADELVTRAMPLQDILTRFPESIRETIKQALTAAKNTAIKEISKDIESKTPKTSHTKIHNIPTIEVKVTQRSADSSNLKISLEKSINFLPKDVYKALEVEASAIPAHIQHVSQIFGNNLLLESVKQEGRWKALLKALVPEVNKPM